MVDIHEEMACNLLILEVMLLIISLSKMKKTTLFATPKIKMKKIGAAGTIMVSKTAAVTQISGNAIQTTSTNRADSTLREPKKM